MKEAEIFDVFIAGGGIIACTFARILVDAGLSVAIADAGEYESRRPGENHKNIWKHQRNLVHYGHFVKGQMYPASVPSADPPSTRNMNNPSQDPNTNLPGAVVAYALGGMAIHWTCAIPRHNADIERINFIPSHDWDVLYNDAEKLLNLHSDIFSGSVRHKVLKRFLNGLGLAATDTPLAGERRRDNPEFVNFVGADTVLGDKLAEPGHNAKLTILAQHRVTRLVHKGEKVRYAEVRDMKSGNDKKIHANTFIVAAGWLHTPQILWNSGIHAHESSALGRYLTDHTFTACTVLLKKEIIDEMSVEAEKMSQNSSDSGLDSLPVPMKDPPPHLYVPISKERLWHSMIFRESFHFDPLPDDVDDRRIIDLKWFGMVDPNPENRVTFSASNRDMLGMPQPTFHVRLGDNDNVRLAQMMDDMKNVAQQLGSYLPGPPKDPKKYEPVIVPLGASTHTMGLTRMSSDEDGGRESVVDSNSKVWGFDNLYVGGNCIIPTANASNPTLTSVALAIRAANQIKSKEA